MSVTVRYSDGVFKPVEDVKDAEPGKLYRVFSEDELRSMKEDAPWLAAAETSFAFWNNEEDAVYDNL